MADQISASHILLMYAGSERSSATRSKDEAQSQIAGIAQQLQDGGDFAGDLSFASDRDRLAGLSVSPDETQLGLGRLLLLVALAKAEVEEDFGLTTWDRLSQQCDSENAEAERSSTAHLSERTTHCCSVAASKSDRL